MLACLHTAYHHIQQTNSTISTLFGLDLNLLEYHLSIRYNIQYCCTQTWLDVVQGEVLCTCAFMIGQVLARPSLSMEIPMMSAVDLPGSQSILSIAVECWVPSTNPVLDSSCMIYYSIRWFMLNIITTDRVCAQHPRLLSHSPFLNQQQSHCL